MLIMENKSSSPLTSNSSFAEIINIDTSEHECSLFWFQPVGPYIPANLYLWFFFPYWQNTARFLGFSLFPLPCSLLCVLCNLFCLIDGYLGGFQSYCWLLQTRLVKYSSHILAHVGKDIYWLHFCLWNNWAKRLCPRTTGYSPVTPKDVEPFCLPFQAPPFDLWGCFVCPASSLTRMLFDLAVLTGRVLVGLLRTVLIVISGCFSHCDSEYTGIWLFLAGQVRTYSSGSVAALEGSRAVFWNW